ncbi:MAG: dockerin type I repeat-containing protein [Clostridia bacterium]|nr:dockerin type I repeat-containing protein [Clostridia bacterium]
MKRTISIILAAVLLFGCFAAVGSAKTLTHDIDGDGELTAQDARLTLRFALGLEDESGGAFHKADADGDGYITAADAREILRKALGIGDPSVTTAPRTTTPTTIPTTVPTTVAPTTSASLPSIDTDFTYYAGADFRRVRNRYPSAEALAGAVINSIVGDEFYVFTYVRYKIISQYSVSTLHNITTGETIEDPYTYFGELADTYWGGWSLYYSDWQIRVKKWEVEAMDCIYDIWTTGSHTGFSHYVDGSEMNL